MSGAPVAFTNCLIRASAGTGKTFQLSNRFIGLIAGGAPIDTVLATTFTRKGAGEIVDRVLSRLAEAALDPQKAAALAGHVEVESVDQRRCLEILCELLRHLHRMRAGTLDSFFMQIARSFSLELGQSPVWEIIDEIAEARLQAEAIRQVLQEESTSDAVRLMNLLTKGEASREISQQLAQLVKGLYEIYLDAPAGAWSAIPRRRQLAQPQLEAALQALADAPLPADKRFSKAREGDLENARDDQWGRFISAGIAAKVAAGEAAYCKKTLEPALVAAYQPLVDHARAYLLDLIVNQTEATYRLLERFDKVYRKLKLRRHAMRFADVTKMLGGAALAERLDEIEYRLDGRIHHLLLDEFQDTNPGQWRVLGAFARRIFESGIGASFFCVGDVKQAIFGWRGGVAEIFDTLEEEFAGLAPRPLNQSYRSCLAVVETVNRVFENLAENPALQKYEEASRRWAARYAKHTTVHERMPGHCRLLTARAASEGEKPAVATQCFAARQIARLKEQMRGYTVGVLVRKNEAVARMICALRDEGVDASEEGGNPLSDSPAVQLVLSLLTLADHPGDRTARFHLATSPLAGAIGLADYEDDRLAARVSLATRRQLAGDGYGESIHHWANALAPSCDRRDLARLMQLVELAYAYDADATGRADDFVAFVKEKRVESPTTADVRVMTFHQAKGLQFDIVVLPELDYLLRGQPPELVVGRPGPMADVEHVCRFVNKEERVVLPSSVQATFDAHQRRVVEESLCVLYVALTRAIHALYMIISPSRENEKTLPSTAAGLLRASLHGTDPVEPETTLYECGDPQWHEKTKRKPAAESPKAEEVLDVRLAGPTGRSARGMEYVSPSQLEGGSRVVLKNRLRLAADKATTRGTIIHKWLELIQWIEDGIPGDDQLRAAARDILAVGIDSSELLRQFHAMLARPQIVAVLSRATYGKPASGAGGSAVHAKKGIAQPRWEVHREWSFAVRDGDTIVTGQIDRLVLLYDGDRAVGADIVDFKTDALGDDPRQIEARVEHYRPQLDAYRNAAAKVLDLPVKQVSARLVFLEPGAVWKV
ncbi:MAG: UvrD-helicase domain-containing protein [Pirellulales bacterium]|nr:UvrD-helicase domain-containing protein [Pirellulales bacterium]